MKTNLIIFLFSYLLSGHPLKAQDSLRNLPEYSLPLSNEKLVIAHCMTNIIRFKGHPLEDSCNPDYYAPKGNISAPLGGLTQVKVMADSLLANATLDEAVEFEMRAAKRSGIDGFQFYYTLNSTAWDEIIKTYFKVADEKNIDFKFTFCISHPNGSTENKKIEQFSKRMNNIFEVVGRENKHWLRTPDGRLIVYLWDGENLADLPEDRQGLPDQYYMAKAYKRLADAVKERFACVFTINKEISSKELNDFLDYFPASWIWTLPYDAKDYIGNRIADQCKQRGRNFTASVFNDFYTSKLLKKNSWDMYYKVSDAVNAGVDKVERKYITTGLSYNFRKLLEFGIERNVSIINVITWNDYPEGHHLAPEINHNDGFSILLNFYKNKWKGLESPYVNRDVAILFYKKYKHDIKPAPYDIPVVPFQKETLAAVTEDSVEVVTLLQSAAELKLNGYIIPIPAGFNVSRFPMDEGLQRVSIIRDYKTSVKFIAPEGITRTPYRSDRITYSFSSEFKEFYKDLFKGFKPCFSTEYNPAFNEKEL